MNNNKQERLKRHKELLYYTDEKLLLLIFSTLISSDNNNTKEKIEMHLRYFSEIREVITSDNFNKELLDCDYEWLLQKLDEFESILNKDLSKL